MSIIIEIELIENYDRYNDEDLFNLIYYGNEEVLNFLIEKFWGNV